MNKQTPRTKGTILSLKRSSSGVLFKECKYYEVKQGFEFVELNQTPTDETTTTVVLYIEWERRSLTKCQAMV